MGGGGGRVGGGRQGVCELRSEAFVKIPKKNKKIGGGGPGRVGGGGGGGLGYLAIFYEESTYEISRL